MRGRYGQQHDQRGAEGGPDASQHQRVLSISRTQTNAARAGKTCPPGAFVNRTDVSNAREASPGLNTHSLCKAFCGADLYGRPKNLVVVPMFIIGRPTIKVGTTLS